MESFIVLSRSSEDQNGVKFLWHTQLVDTEILEPQTGPQLAPTINKEFCANQLE
jgi:hypothetical protein